jgi:hypothetical protein
MQLKYENAFHIHMQQDANAALPASIDLNSFDAFLYFTPAICGIGVSFVGGTDSYVNSNHADTFAHELGHLLGFMHSNLDLNDDNVSDEECAF